MQGKKEIILLAVIVVGIVLCVVGGYLLSTSNQAGAVFLTLGSIFTICALLVYWKISSRMWKCTRFLLKKVTKPCCSWEDEPEDDDDDESQRRKEVQVKKEKVKKRRGAYDPENPNIRIPNNKRHIIRAQQLKRSMRLETGFSDISGPLNTGASDKPFVIVTPSSPMNSRAHAQNGLSQQRRNVSETDRKSILKNNGRKRERGVMNPTFLMDKLYEKDDINDANIDQRFEAASKFPNAMTSPKPGTSHIASDAASVLPDSDDDEDATVIFRKGGKSLTIIADVNITHENKGQHSEMDALARSNVSQSYETS